MVSPSHCRELARLLERGTPADHMDDGRALRDRYTLIDRNRDLIIRVLRQAADDAAELAAFLG